MEPLVDDEECGWQAPALRLTNEWIVKVSAPSGTRIFRLFLALVSARQRDVAVSAIAVITAAMTWEPASLQSLQQRE
jgi:hypothetical protein